MFGVTILLGPTRRRLVSPYSIVTNHDKWRARISIAASTAPLPVVLLAYVLFWRWMPRVSS